MFDSKGEDSRRREQQKLIRGVSGSREENTWFASRLGDVFSGFRADAASPGCAIKVLLVQECSQHIYSRVLPAIYI